VKEISQASKSWTKGIYDKGSMRIDNKESTHIN